jgi:tetratricopeptide (TPR) repeat protein
MKRQTAKHGSPAQIVPQPLEEQIFAEAVKFHHANLTDKAETMYRAVLALNPKHSEACYNMGLLFHLQGRLDDAVVAYRDAIFARSDHVDAYANLGTVMKDQGKRKEAVIFYRQALAFRPTHSMTHSNLGVALNDLGLAADALTSFRRAIALSPDYEWAYVNMAPPLLESGHAPESATACRRALRLNPDLPIARYNLGASLKATNQIAEAVECFRECVRLKPDFGEAHFGLGQMLLMQGDYAAGWPEYEWRWTLAEYAWLRNIHGEFKQPRWRGENVHGKTVLVYAEQGLGDAIQYARYIPFIRERGANVILAVHPPLKPLFACLEGVRIVGLDDVPLPPFDMHCPLLGLPEIFNTRIDTVPAKIPYLSFDPERAEKWRDRIGGDGFKVGVVWAGNPTQKGDRWRSPRLAAVSPIFSLPGIDFVALQKGPGRDDLTRHPLPANVLDLGNEIADFADTAAIMASLDLVITSCTAPLHLAGALGVKTWALIPYAPHFLWKLGRDDSPWYPSLKLYRQDRPGDDWSLPVRNMMADLEALTAAPAPRKRHSR